jgi:hypothetical protein
MEVSNVGLNKKSVGLVILFSIITCGIYMLYWIYDTTRQLATYNRDEQTSPGLTVVFCIITCGIYTIYWWYKIGGMFIRSQKSTGVKLYTDNRVLFVILSIFGFGIISQAILQADLNRFWDYAEKQLNNPQQNVKASNDEWMDY